MDPPRGARDDSDHLGTVAVCARGEEGRLPEGQVNPSHPTPHMRTCAWPFFLGYCYSIIRAAEFSKRPTSVSLSSSVEDPLAFAWLPTATKARKAAFLDGEANVDTVFAWALAAGQVLVLQGSSARPKRSRGPCPSSGITGACTRTRSTPIACSHRLLASKFVVVGGCCRQC